MPGGNRTDLPRQQTLKAMVDWSYALLTPVEQTLFRRLSVFASGFTLEASEAVCADTQVPVRQIPDLLVALVSKSLVEKTTEPQEDTARYRLLETLRQYGAELLDEDETAQLRQIHLTWFLTFAEEASALLGGGRANAPVGPARDRA